MSQVILSTNEPPSSETRTIKPNDKYSLESSNIGNWIDISELLTSQILLPNREFSPITPLFQGPVEPKKSPVRVDQDKLVSNIREMEVDHPYLISFRNRLFALRKTHDGLVETIEFLETEGEKPE